MTDQHRATESEWYYVKNRIGHGKSDLVAYSCILELRDRIGALEAAQPAQSNHPAKPDSSLVKRVACAIYPYGSGDGFREEARDAIREVAAWLREQYGPIVSQSAMRLEREAKR